MQEKTARRSLKFNEGKFHDFFKTSLFEDYREFGETKRITDEEINIKESMSGTFS